MEDRKGISKALYIKILTAFISAIFFVAAPAGASEDHGPYFGEDSTPDHATTGDPFDFTVQCQGCFPQMVVDVRYRYDDGPVIIEPLEPRGKYSIWSTTVNIRSTPGTIHYRFGGFDSTGGWVYTEWKSIPVIDNDPPVLVIDRGAYYATPGGMYRFDVVLSDNDKLASVWVDVWFDDGEPSTMYLSEVGENRFSQDLLVPWTGSTRMHYVLHALDRADNPLEAHHRSIPVEADLTPPTFGHDLSDTEGTTGDEFRLGIIVLDDFGLAEVRVEYRFGKTALTYAPMEGKLRFRLRVQAPLHSTEMLVYRFYAVDLAGNTNATEWKTAPITDNDPPSADAGEYLQVWKDEIVVLNGSGSNDNIGIESYIWSYVMDGIEESLSGEMPEYSFPTVGDFNISLVVRDLEGNSEDDHVWVRVFENELEPEELPVAQSVDPVLSPSLLALVVLVLIAAVAVVMSRLRSEEDM